MATDILDSLVRRASGWSDEDLEDLDAYARVIEARRTGVYRVGTDERAAIEQGLAEAERGDFVTEEAERQARERHRS